MRVTVSSGGHPPPYVIRNDGSRRPVECGGTLLGFIEGVALRDVGRRTRVRRQALPLHRRRAGHPSEGRTVRLRRTREAARRLQRNAERKRLPSTSHTPSPSCRADGRPTTSRSSSSACGRRCSTSRQRRSRYRLTRVTRSSSAAPTIPASCPSSATSTSGTGRRSAASIRSTIACCDASAEEVPVPRDPTGDRDPLRVE